MGQGSSKRPQPFPVPLIQAPGFQPTGFQRSSKLGPSLLLGDSYDIGGNRRKNTKGKEREGRYGSTGYVQDTTPYPYTAQFEGFYSQPGVQPGPSVGFIPPLPTDQQHTQPTFASSAPRNSGSGMPQGATMSMPVPQIPADPHSRHRHRHSEPTLESVLEPLPPPNPAVWGPSVPRPLTPLRNPLPPPPKDLYETSPYRSLLRDLPENAALLPRSYTLPGQSSLDADRGSRSSGLFGRKKSRKSASGLFHSHSSSRAPDSRIPRHQTVSIFPAAVTQAPNSAGFAPQYIPPPPFIPQSTIPQPQTQAQQEPPQPASVPPVKFDQHSHAGFLNHSPHRILYENKMYPSALHLHEALKFIEHKPELAERIREVRDIQDVYPLSYGFQKFLRSDWGTVFLQKMDDVLYLKFKQHPDLRALLVNTGIADIIYTEANDLFWGSGPLGEGANQLGKALVRVRQKLRSEGFAAGGGVGA